MLMSGPGQYGLPAFDLISREELKRLCWDEGRTDAEIAQMFRISSNQVHRKRVQMNLVHGGMTSEQLADVVRLSETIKSLPPQAISEIQEVVNRYQLS